jgi:hypothetical protein
MRLPAPRRGGGGAFPLPLATFVLGVLVGLAGSLHSLLLAPLAAQLPAGGHSAAALRRRTSLAALGGGGSGVLQHPAAAAAGGAHHAPLTRAPPPGGRNLVICLADGVEYNGAAGVRWLARFAGSFRRHDADAKLVFLTTGVSDTVAPWLEAYDLTPVTFGNETEPWASMEVAARRWYLIHKYLTEHEAEHAAGGWVAAVDARDLWFQSSPFDWPRAPGDELYVFYEQQEDGPATIAENAWNQEVIAACYNTSDPAVEAALQHPVSCSGTVMGSYAAMRRYVSLMSEEMLARSTDKTCMETGGRDQGFHNMLLHTGALARHMRVTAFDNEDGGLVRTLGSGSVFMDLTGRVLSNRGEPVSMVHQWDRVGTIFAIIDNVLFPALKPDENGVVLPPEFPARRRSRHQLEQDTLARGLAQSLEERARAARGRGAGAFGGQAAPRQVHQLGPPPPRLEGATAKRGVRVVEPPP